MALWVGLNLRQRGEPGFKVGVWGINMLLSLPAFGLDGDILKMTAAVDDLMDDALIRALKDNALVSATRHTASPVDASQRRRVARRRLAD